jgi:6-phosphofructokinase 1
MLAVQLLQQGEHARMVALTDGNYQHVPIGTLLTGTKSVDVAALYDPERYRARLVRVQGMPMFLY